MKVKSFMSGCAAICAALTVIALSLPVFADPPSNKVHIRGWVDCLDKPTCDSRNTVKVYKEDGTPDGTQDLRNTDVRGNHEFNSEYGLVKIGDYWVRANLLEREFCKSTPLTVAQVPVVGKKTKVVAAGMGSGEQCMQ